MSDRPYPATLAQLIDQTAMRQGKAVALVDDGLTWSFAELADQSNALAAGLNEAGLKPGHRVAIWLPNMSLWLVALLALSRLGAAAVCINTRFRAAEVADILARTSPRALIYVPHDARTDYSQVLSEVDPALLPKLILAVREEGAIVGATPISDLLKPRGEFASAAAPDNAAIMFTTSGTTSKPKFVLHDQRSLADHAQQVARAFEYDRPDASLLQALPLCGTFGLSQALAGLAAGAPSTILSDFDADTALKLISRNRITSFNGTDEMFARMLVNASSTAFSTVDWCGFASFGIADAEEFVRSAERGGLKLLGLYGMSEVQALFARQPEGLPPQERALAGGRLTSPEAAVEVRDPDTGQPLPPGTSGELYLRGPSRFAEYYGNPAATAETIGEDGFVRSGDLGYLRDDGRFIFETRMGDSLRLGGFLVNPAEIDAWLESDNSVEASQTVAVELDGRLRAISFVVANQSSAIDEAGLIDHCTGALARFKVPARIVQVDAFPVTDGPNGVKIKRSELHDMAKDIARRTS